jgi:hypothetical protein
LPATGGRCHEESRRQRYFCQSPSRALGCLGRTAEPGGSGSTGGSSGNGGDGGGGSNNQGIELPFALLSSDELQSPAVGEPCTFPPITVAGKPFKESGSVDLDPTVNPAAGYELALQVENNESPESDGSHDFHVTDGVVTYVAQQAYLTPGLPPSVTVLVSGTVAPGGTAEAAAVLIQTLGPGVVATLQQDLQALTAGQGASPGGDLDLDVVLEGTLGNGQSVTSDALDFPLHVCLDCLGVAPIACLDGLTAAPVGHGPCCAPQDFSDQCVACGGTGQPCCALPDTVPLVCAQDSDCYSFGLGLTPPGGGAPAVGDCFIPAGVAKGTCICQGNADCEAFFGESSTCTAYRSPRRRRCLPIRWLWLWRTLSTTNAAS